MLVADCYVASNTLLVQHRLYQFSFHMLSTSFERTAPSQNNDFSAWVVLTASAVIASKSSKQMMIFFKIWTSSMSIWTQARQLMSNSF